MKFLCLVEFTPDAFSGMTEEDQRLLDDATIAHDRKLRRSGHLLFASPLADTSEAVVVDHRRRLDVATVDGPFAESKEIVGGFLLIDAASIEQARQLLEDSPITRYGKLTIRAVIEDHRHSETDEARPAIELR